MKPNPRLLLTRPSSKPRSPLRLRCAVRIKQLAAQQKRKPLGRFHERTQGGVIAPRTIAALLTVALLASCESAVDESVSDYAVYETALLALRDSAPTRTVAIRRIAGVLYFEDEIYYPGGLNYYEEMIPGFDTSLVSTLRERVPAKPKLFDSINVPGIFGFLEEEDFLRLADLHHQEARALADSIVDGRALVACLTPPAQIEDQALLYIAFPCWEQGTLLGQYYFMRRSEGVWAIEEIIPMSVN